MFSTFLIVLSIGLIDENWSQFRGSNSTGVYVGKKVPVEFGVDKNELWRLELPPGHSSPVIHGDNLFLTGFYAESKTLEVLCISRSTGIINWRSKYKVNKLERGHPSFNPASSTPVTDGERVVAYFGSYGLVCLDNEGKMLWELKLPLTRSYAGNATSPCIIGNKVILYRGNMVDHYVLALDKENGKELWRVPQEEPFSLELACTACPIVIGKQLILHTARSVQSLDIESGKQNWVVKCATTATSTPVLDGEQVIVAAWNKMGEPALRPKFPGFDELLKKNDKDGDRLLSPDEYPSLWIFHRPEGIEAPENGATLRFRSVDSNRDGKLSRDEWEVQLKKIESFRAGYKTHGMLAIPVKSDGLIKQDEVKTIAQQGIPEVPSPLVKDRLVYFVKNGGQLTCIDLENNKQVYRKRVFGRGTYYASPVIANNRLYSFSGDGKYSVVELGRSGKLISKGDLGEKVYASPAVQDGVIYVRTHQRLYAFGFKP